jgi:transcriptional regulator with XRE-family HTH domain
MSTFSDNIRYLREGRKETQQEIAQNLDIKRSRYEPYESGKTEAPYDILKKVSNYFGISIDLLLSVDMRKIKIDQLVELEGNRLLLPIAVDANGDNMIEIVTQKAKAGYALGYADPGFIESLQHISLPFLRNGKFRAFPIEGDSMPPHKDRSYIVGEYVENLGDVMDGKTYILLTKSDGIVYKRLNKNGKNSLILQSDNSLYKPYEVKVSEVLEIWRFACSISLDEFEPDDLGVVNIRDMFLQLQEQMKTIKTT